MAGYVASWQRLLNGYLTNGGQGQQRNYSGGRQDGNINGGINNTGVTIADGQTTNTNSNDSLRQRTLNGTILRNPSDYWGDQIRPKEEHQLRIIFQNINRFPLSSQDPKNDSIRAFLKGV